MNIEYALPILRKNKWHFLWFPLIVGLMVFFMSRYLNKEYYTEILLYTGITTGITGDNTNSGHIDYYATKAKFDNIINLVKSKQVLEKTSIILLAQDLCLKRIDPHYISPSNQKKLISSLPRGILSVVSKKTSATDSFSCAFTQEQIESLGKLCPKSVDPVLFRQTVQNLFFYYKKDKSNIIHRKLIKDKMSFYSLNQLRKINVHRVGNSDMVKISYQCNDAGICFQTLNILYHIFSFDYNDLYLNQTNSVVKYFEERLIRVTTDLHKLEDSLLMFQQRNDLINYHEQTKFIASQKEQLEVDIQNQKALLASSNAILRQIEINLSDRDSVFLKSQKVIDSRKELEKLNYKLYNLGLQKQRSLNESYKTDSLKNLISTQEAKIKLIVDQLFLYKHSNQGVPIRDLLSKWVENVINKAKAEANILVLESRMFDFKQKYFQFAPLGAKLNGIKREIKIKENAYKEILHGLSLAKLKEKNSMLTASLELIDPPYFPYHHRTLKSLFFALIAMFFAALFLLFILIIIDYFTFNLLEDYRVVRLTGISNFYKFPKIKPIDYSKSDNRLLEFENYLVSFILRDFDFVGTENTPQKLNLFFSTQFKSGKTFFLSRVQRVLLKANRKFMYIEIDKNIVRGYVNGQVMNELPIFDVFDLDINRLKAKLFDPAIYSDSDYSVWIEIPSIYHHSYSLKIFSRVDNAFYIFDTEEYWEKKDTIMLQSVKQNYHKKPILILNRYPLQKFQKRFSTFLKTRSDD
ncbi:MAG: hypothetical protein ACEPOW_10660 [Bacteroidales bacterium]